MADEKDVKVAQEPTLPSLRQGADGHWYFPDPNRPGKWLRIL